MSFKLSVVVVCLALIGLVSALSPHEEWSAYKSKHGKNYQNRAIDSMRRAIFEKAKQSIEKFNAERAPRLGYKRGLNHLSDWTESEKKILNGFKLPKDGSWYQSSSPRADEYVNKILNDNSIEIPESVDWRDVTGRVTPVKNQGYCGSCWAFATTGVLEGQEAIKGLKAKGQLISLSEQNLVDCATGNCQGCQGGFITDALTYVHKQGGIDTEESYPYMEFKETCHFNKSTVAFTDMGYWNIPSGDEQKLKEVVAKVGPVAVGINAMDGFLEYDHGVMVDKFCENEQESLNHGVLVVGYGTDKELGDYWIVVSITNDCGASPPPPSTTNSTTK